MADLSTKYLGLNLRNPVIVGSSGLTGNIKGIKEFDRLGAGAIVLKSIFEEQILMEGKKAVNNTDLIHPEAAEYVSNIIKDQSVYDYLNLIEESKKAVSIPIIASINCFTTGDWTGFAKKIESAGADALELNVFIINFNREDKSEDIEKKYYKILSKVKKEIDIPVVLKISSQFTNINRVLNGLVREGANGFVLFNRYFSSNIDLKKMEIIPGHSFSSQDEITLPLRWISLLSEELGCDISASTGVYDAESVIKLILVGATTVQVCSALYKSGMKYLSVIIEGVQKWLDKNSYRSIDDIRGIMSCKTEKDRKIFSRSQFMKYYSRVV